MSSHVKGFFRARGANPKRLIAAYLTKEASCPIVGSWEYKLIRWKYAIAADADLTAEKETAESATCCKYSATVTSDAGNGHLGSRRSRHHVVNLFQHKTYCAEEEPATWFTADSRSRDDNNTSTGSKRLFQEGAITMRTTLCH